MTDGPAIERFRFTGTWQEYFGIWIVNLFLTVVTLGIYSAWAKVRRKRYFYGNTWLQESNFDYHGDPVAILKGRLIAFTAFIAYTVGAQFSPKAASVVLLVLLPALPWMILRSYAFNAVNSSYRNLRFHFSGRYGDVLLAIAPFAVVPLGGLLLPEVDPANPPKKMADVYWMFLPTVLLALVYPYIVARLKLIHVNGTRYGTASFHCRASVARFYGVYFLALLIVVAIGAAIWVAMPLLWKMGPSLLFAIPVAYVLAGAILFGFTQSRVANLVFNTTRLQDRAEFESSLSAARLARIYAVNLFAILLTFGFMIPWAAIRVARYRAECLALECEGGLEAFVADVSRDVPATGEEMGEMFDMDLSL